MSKVYVLIDQKHKDRYTGEWVSKFDFSTAEQYGELVFVLPSEAQATDPNTNGELAHGLSDITDEDYILPVGSPVIILLAGVYSVLGDNQITKLNVLEWDRSRERVGGGRYVPITINLLLE